MGSIYKAEDDIVDMMKVLVGQHHPDLALIVDEIAVVVREKAGKRGGKAILGKSAKASPLIGVLGDTDYKFVIELAGDEWVNLTTKQKNALLDHLLCSCRAEEGDDGNQKFTLAPPDVAFYWDELDRHGDWRPRPEDEGSESNIEDIFGKED